MIVDCEKVSRPRCQLATYERRAELAAARLPIRLDPLAVRELRVMSLFSRATPSFLAVLVGCRVGPKHKKRRGKQKKPASAFHLFVEPLSLFLAGEKNNFYFSRITQTFRYQLLFIRFARAGLVPRRVIS